MKRVQGAVTALCEPLEGRKLFSGPPPYPFVSAGLTFDGATDQVASMFWAEGTVYADNSFTGTYERFNATSRSGSGVLPWAGFRRVDDDRMKLLGPGGTDAYASQNALQFIAQQGYPIGPFVGRRGDGGVQDVGLFAEPYFPGPFWVGVYLQQDYFVATMMVMTSGGGVQGATLVATPSFFKSEDYTFDYHMADGSVVSTQEHVVSSSPTVTVFSNGVRVYSTYQRATNFFLVDPDGSDGIVGYGVGLARWAQAPDSVHADQVPGVYFGNVQTAGAASGGFLGVTPSGPGVTGAGAADVVVQIDAGGSFIVFAAGAYNAGLRTPVNTGTWAYRKNDRTQQELDLGQLELTDTQGRVAVVRVARNAELVVKSVAAPGESTESVLGVLEHGTYTPIGGGLVFEEAVFSTDELGHLIVYQHAISSDATKVGWYWTDLVDRFDTTTVSGSVYSWHELNFTSVAVVARGSDGHLLYWERTGGNWAFTDLTASIAGAKALAGELSGVTFGRGTDNFRHPTGAIVSTDADGKFIAYVQQSGNQWTFVDVEADGLLGEGIHPSFTGPLAGFGTNWGGFNFAGLDDQGRIWVLWYAPALNGHWATNNLSEIAGGTPTIVSHLTAVTTPWYAFQVSGLDANGHILVTWWAREVGWRYDGLTDLTGGPACTGVELTSNYSVALNVINVIGIDQTGNAVVYWWNPKTGWAIGYPVSGLDGASRPSGAMQLEEFQVPYTNVPGLVASFQSITWRSADGHTKRLVWYTNAPDAWALEDLTDLGVPLVGL